MEESTLLAIGCAVTFVALAGAFVYLEGAFDKSVEAEDRESPSLSGSPTPLPAAVREPLKSAGDRVR